MIPPPIQHRFSDGFEFVWEDLGVKAVVTRIEEGKKELSGEVSVANLAGGLLHFARLNFLAARSRAEVARHLSSRMQEVDWPGLLEQMTKAVVSAWRVPPEPVLLSDSSVTGVRLSYMVRPLIPTNQVTVFYGPGESAKSLIAMALCAALEKGVSCSHFTVPACVSTLYLDWEDSEAVAASRLRAIAAGLSIDVPPVSYYAMTRPLQESAGWLEREVKVKKIGLVVIDSYVPAAGTEPEGADAAQRLFSAARSLDTTCLILSHISKADVLRDRALPFGSVMATNLARSAWEFRQSENDDYSTTETTWVREIRLGLYQRKANLGRRQSTGLRIRLSGSRGAEFHGAADTISFAPLRIDDDADLSERQGLGTMIVNCLRETKRAMTTGEVAAWVDAPSDSVSKACRRHPEILRIEPEGDVGKGGRGRQVLWALRSSREEP